MKATELRIGNLVNYDTAEGDVFTNVIDWQDLKWLSEDEQGFNLVHNPIPLTEEWLLKFAFESDEIEWWNGILSIGICKEGLRYLPTEKINFRVGIVLQYVHQLQNLYFALTNEELTLKK